MPFANKNACKLPGVQTHQAQMLSLAFYPPKRKKKTSLFFLIVEVMCTPCKQILTVYKGVNRNVAGYCNFIFQREIWLLIRWGFFWFFFLSFQNPTWPDMFAMALPLPSWSPTSSLPLLWLCRWYSIFCYCPHPHPCFQLQFLKFSLSPRCCMKPFNLYPCMQCVLWATQFNHINVSSDATPSLHLDHILSGHRDYTLSFSRA